MGRRSGMSDSTDALELFLDTICNAFGGIIFISLLVCVMLQLSGDVIDAKTDPHDPVRKAKLQAKLKEVQDEIDKLIAIRQTQITQLPMLKNSTDSATLDKYAKLSKRQVELEVIKNRLLKVLGVKKIDQETNEQFLAKLTKEEEKIEKETAELATIIKKQQSAASRANVRTPSAKRTRKKQVPILLSGGRISFVYKHNDTGVPVAENTAEVNIVKIPGEPGKAQVFISPKPGQGVTIENTDVFAAQLTTILSKFNAKPRPGVTEANCHYLMVAVWPDSHTQFEILRDMITKKDFGYGLILMEKDGKVTTGGAGEEQ
jgi:hypothetical protein